MENYSLDNIAHALGFDKKQKQSNYTCWGIMQSVNSDGTYNILIDGQSSNTRCSVLCRASTGDRVLITVINGIPYVTNVLIV